MNKRIGVFVSSALLLLSMLIFPADAYAAGAWVDGLAYNAGCTFDGGTGTEGDPFVIETETSLAQLAVNVNDGAAPLSYSGVYFRLDEDLDLAGAMWIPIGAFVWGSLDGRDPFSGNFDGNGHTISNMTVSEPARIGLGLFGYTTGALIEDLGVEDCNVTGQGMVGGLAGFADEFTGIHNCYTTGTVTALVNSGIEYGYNGEIAGGLVGNYGNALSTIDGCWSSADVDGDSWIGGLIGYMSAAHVTNSYATGNVGSLVSYAYDAGGFIGGLDQSVIENCFATGDVTGNGVVGGFAGEAYSNGDNNSITNCYSRGNVTSTNQWGWSAGGFLGEAEDVDFFNCYSSGDVSFTSQTEAYYIGGFVGNVEDNVTCTSCFFDAEVTGRDAQGNSDDWGSSALAGITGLTTANMQGYDTLLNAEKMDALDSGAGAPVSEIPVWYPHSADYPDFEAEYCDVAFDSKDADTAASPAVKSAMLGCSVDALPSDPEKAEHIFGGWWTEANGGGTQFTASTSVPGDITVFAKWTELTLESTDADGKIYTGGRITLTPNIDGGTWDWDEAYFTATFNSPATFTALKAGTSTITYTVDGVSTTYDVTIEESGLPSTGQDMTWVWLLIGAALAVGAAGVFARRRMLAVRRR